jgi:hypothetical protein
MSAPEHYRLDLHRQTTVHPDDVSVSVSPPGRSAPCFGERLQVDRDRSVVRDLSGC